MNIQMIRELLSEKRKEKKIGIICRDDSLTYEEWHNNSEELSRIILKEKSHKLIGLFLPNSIAYAVSYFACLYANKAIVPFYIENAKEEIALTLIECNINVIITSREYAAYIRQISIDYELSIKIVIVNAVGEIESKIILSKQDLLCENWDQDLKDVVVLLPTSGTTSKSKRVMLTNYGLLANIKAHCEALHLTSEEVGLIQLPMMFGYCNTAQFLAHIYLGASSVIGENHFLIGDFYRTVERWKITNFTTVPSILLTFSKNQKRINNISTLKKICFGGGAISVEQLEKIITMFPNIKFIQTYGLTEAGPRVTALPEDSYVRKIGSVGKAIPNVYINIVDDNNQSLPKGKVGEIIVKSDGVMKGYFKNPEDTKKILRRGWLYTGDLGYLTEDDFLYVVGRKKNIIISGGLNICPEEVEKVLLLHSNILDAKVYGKEDELYGEIVCADIVVKNNNPDLIKTLKMFCKEKLSKYKVPAYFFIVNKIEKTYNGKTERSKKR